MFNFVFTAVFCLEAIMKLYALGFKLYLKERWNKLDVMIVIFSIVGILLEEVESNLIPINPTIIRVMRVARIARVLKLLKMAKGMRALLNTVMQALPQVGNLGLLFFLLFFIFAALGVELFGRLGRIAFVINVCVCVNAIIFDRLWYPLLFICNRMWRRPSMPRHVWTRQLWEFRHCIFDAVSSGHRW